MNFTREPIIETIVSPKDGYKLCIRNSKIAGSEEFFVDAVEIVSFGSSLFFRVQEKPKPFLVPISDYEVFEVKETRVVLKNIAHDRNIKIGGGRDAPVRPSKEAVIEKKEEEFEEDLKEPLSPAEVPVEVGNKNDRKRDRRRNRRRRLVEEKKEGVERDKASEDIAFAEDSIATATEGGVKNSSMTFTHLLPPPPILISEKLNKMKEMAEALVNASKEEPEEREVPKGEDDSFPI